MFGFFSMFEFRLRPIVVLSLLLQLAAVAYGQVPDELQLPGETQASTPVDELQLAQIGPPANEVPDETILPGAAPAAGDDGNSPLSPGDLRPHLRLRFDGHTARINEVAISADGKYLLSAGDDKELHLWARETIDAKPGQWYHRRTLRWQVERGPRGRIDTIAVHENLVAIAGQGAMGGNGEIWIYDFTTGRLLPTLLGNLPAPGDSSRCIVADAAPSDNDAFDAGHRQVVHSLAWQPNSKDPALASADREGHVILWRRNATTGAWSPKTIVAADEITYGKAIGDALQPLRSFLAIVFLGQDQLLVPRYVGVAAEPAGAARWQLQRYRLSTNKSDLIAIDHLHMMTAMTGSSDALRLASGDAMGNLCISTFDPAGTLTSSKRNEPATGVPLSLKWNSTATRLLVSNLIDAETGSLEYYDTSDPKADAKRISDLSLSAHGVSCEFDAGTNQAITVADNKLVTYQIANEKFVPRIMQTLAPTIRPVREVAFTNSSPPYVVGIRTRLDQAAGFDHVFDLSTIKLEPTVAPEIWIKPTDTKGEWSISQADTSVGTRPFLNDGKGVTRLLPLRPDKDGIVTGEAYFEVTAETKRQAVMIGTNMQNNVYVYERNDAADAKLLRQFRGHHGAVRSISVSADRRYAVSGGDDAMICVWKLEDVFTVDELTNRWGTSFELRGKRLFAIGVRRDGPLFFRGVREGDELVGISWHDDQTDETKIVIDPQEIFTALSAIPFDAQVCFDFKRLGRPLKGFQSFAAWHPVATLFVDQTRQWAFWTPAGFYDASFGGNRLFGWQINRGVSNAPDYFLAEQFKQRLENAPAMRRLLDDGDLSTAMEKGVSGIGPPTGEDAITSQILSKPTITLISPRENETIQNGEVVVRADITVPRGATLQPPKVFAGGVPAVNRELLNPNDAAQTGTYQYRWTSRVPSDSRLTLEVVAATDAGASDRVSVELVNDSVPRRLPRLHFLSLGVSQYSDPQITKLDFAADGAHAMATLFRERTLSLYRTTTSELLDKDAIRPLWREYAKQAARELSSDITPDDLVIMYFCGHGFRDVRTNQWYFVTADARHSDVMNNRYADLISFDDLAMLGELPCRKLAIIDSCHSGAVQPLMRSDDLKSVIRMLQGDVVLTITASEGEEEAAEQKDRGLGRFTSDVVDALQGIADANGDGVVTLQETIGHVVAAADRHARESGFTQHPTAGPADLLKLMDLPLTRTMPAD